MSSDVDICNLALAHLGDSATVSSIDPPEGSAQSDHCARFYPLARNSLLEMHQWGFATKRVAMAQVTSAWPQWAYAYIQPSDAINLLSVLAPDAPDDYTAQFIQPIQPISGTLDSYAPGGYWLPNVSVTTPQPFVAETDDQGRALILTNQADALLRYTGVITDPTKFPPLFVQALTWHLASMLAGPILKGDAGATQSARCAQMMEAWLTKAKLSDAGQRRVIPQTTPGWIAGR